MATSSSALPDILTLAERKILLKKLTEIREGAEKSSKDRFEVAMKAFRAAVKSDVAAHDLYVKCVEKANFDDQKRSSQEFREWKRQHKDTQNTLEFRRALQHQLNWLLLTVEASAKPDEIQTLAREALGKVDAIMEDHETLESHHNILKQDVLSSVYAKAYNINGLKARDWPKSPLEIKEIYDKLVFPSLRNPQSITKLRRAWRKRIEHEGLILKNWGEKPKSGRVGKKRDELPAGFMKWKEEQYPELLWIQEMECYEAGDQKQAATNMLIHLGHNVNHKKSLKWTNDFKSLIELEMNTSESDNDNDNDGEGN